jgi:Tol biopolymer transport system component
VSKPAWSADGTQLAFIATEGDRNAIVLADGTGTTNQILFEADGESFETIGWAPDATAVVAASNEDDDRRPVGHGRAIRLIPLDGSEPTTLYTETDDATLLSPRFTPDGSAVLFVRLLPIPEADPAGFPSGAEILRVPVSGGSPEVIWQGGDEVSGMSNLAWSPDGRYVLFFATGSGLILMDMDSGAITRTAVHGGDAFIGTNFEASSPAWRPVP